MIRGEARLSHAATENKTQYGQFKVPTTRRKFLIKQSQPNQFSAINLGNVLPEMYKMEWISEDGVDRCRGSFPALLAWNVVHAEDGGSSEIKRIKGNKRRRNVGQ